MFEIVLLFFSPPFLVRHGVQVLVQVRSWFINNFQFHLQQLLSQLSNIQLPSLLPNQLAGCQYCDLKIVKYTSQIFDLSRYPNTEEYLGYKAISIQVITKKSHLNLQKFCNFCCQTLLVAMSFFIFFFSSAPFITSKFLRDIEILGWCPAGSVLPCGEKVPLQPWLATLLVMVSR